MRRIWFFAVDNWKVLLPASFLLVVLCWVLWSFARSRPAPKLDQKEIIEAQQAIAERDDAKMRDILAASDVREKQIDANVAAGRTETVNAIADAKKRYEAMPADELAAELERRAGN